MLQRASDRERALGTGWWDYARFHLCLRQSAGKQFSGLKRISSKDVISYRLVVELID